VSINSSLLKGLKYPVVYRKLRICGTVQIFGNDNNKSKLRPGRKCEFI